MQGTNIQLQLRTKDKYRSNLTIYAVILDELGNGKDDKGMRNTS